jgi:hypothetical protein
VVEELDPKALKPYLYDDVFKSFLGLVDVRNHREEDTMQSVKFRERCQLARELIRGLGFASAVDDGIVSSDDLVANFARGVVTGPAFANRKRTNELFGFGKPMVMVDVLRSVTYCLPSVEGGNPNLQLVLTIHGYNEPSAWPELERRLSMHLIWSWWP